MESVAHIALLAFYIKQYDLSDCIVKKVCFFFFAKKLAKTLKADKTGRKVSWSFRLESIFLFVCLFWFEM